MPPVELVLKSGTAAILLLTGLLLLRDRRHMTTGPFGGLLALSVAATHSASSRAGSAAALRGIADKADHAKDNPRIQTDKLFAILESARAAIAKAEGKQ